MTSSKENNEVFPLFKSILCMDYGVWTMEYLFGWLSNTTVFNLDQAPKMMYIDYREGSYDNIAALSVTRIDFYQNIHVIRIADNLPTKHIIFVLCNALQLGSANVGFSSIELSHF